MIRTNSGAPMARRNAMTRPMEAPHRFAFRLLFAAQVCIGIGQSVLFAALPPAAREIGLSPFRVSLIFVVSASIWVFVSPMWGRRSDVWGRRPVILIGLLGFALSMFLLATMIQIGLAGLLPLAVVYPLMIVSRSVFALIGSGTGPAAQAYVADRTSVADRTTEVALLTAGFALGQTVGPAIGALLAVAGVLAPLYLSAVLAVASAAAVWFLLPEAGPPLADGATRSAKLSFRDPRVLPYVTISASLQAVRATTTITLAFLLQDRLGLTARETVQYAGVGFMALALAGLVTQVVLVQRLKPSAQRMIQMGLPLVLLASVALCVGGGPFLYLVALVAMGVGLGLVRPGSAAGASIAVGAREQGAVAGLISGIAVVGNIVGPMLGTAVYELTPAGPYFLNSGLMVAMLVFFHVSPRLGRGRHA